MTTSMPTFSPAWGRYPTSWFVRWARQVGLAIPAPLVASAVGSAFRSPTAHAPGVSRREVELSEAEERMLTPIARVLARPSRCGYVVRSVTGGPETYYVGLARGGDGVVVVDAPGEIQLAAVPASSLAAVIASELPRFVAARVPSVDLDSFRVAQMEAGARVLPEDVERRLGAPASAVLATGAVAAIAYQPRWRGGTCAANWAELADGGMISSTTRRGGILHEPLSAVAVRRALAAAMASLD